MRYSACIATYRRPEGLTALLESLEAQQLPEGAELEIVVVDNDPPSAAPVVEAFRQRSRHIVVDGAQPEPNISLTRNATVALATGEWVWFIDDDERAAPDCLLQLAAVADRTDADVAFGDVLPDFEAEVPDWMANATLFKRPTPRDGADSRADRTGNTLVRRSVLDEQPGPFAEELGKTGGEDSDLFDRVRRAGHRLVETPKAYVWETVPEDRSEWSWMVERSRRLGRLYSDRVVRNAGGNIADPEVLKMLGKAAVQVAAYGVGSLAAWSRIDLRRKYQQKFHLNVGKLTTLSSGGVKSPWS